MGRANESLGISVIVPISGRIRYLEELGLSYHRIKPCSIKYELIIVDNSKNISDQISIKEYCLKNSFIYYLTAPGVAIARNTGASLARFSYLLFVDSDCTFDENILIEYEKNIFQGCKVAAGQTVFYGSDSFLWRRIGNLPYLMPFKWSCWEDSLPWAPLSNFLIAKNVFTEISGIKGILNPTEVGGEDVDLGIRLTEKKYIIYPCPQSKILHTKETWKSFLPIIDRVFRYGKAESELILLHPNRRKACLPSVTSLLWFCSLIAILSCPFDIQVSKYILIWLAVLILTQPLLNYCTYAFGKKSVSFIDIIYFYIFKFFYESGKLYQALKNVNPIIEFYCFVFSNNVKSEVTKVNLLRLFSIIVSLLLLIVIIVCKN